MTSIIQFADIHFGVEDQEAMGCVKGAIEKLHPDIIVICGDITQNGSDEEFKAAHEWIKTLDGPKLITPGNHDTPMYGLIERFTRPFAKYRKWIEPLSEPYFTNKDVTILPYNSARGWQFGFDWSLGAVNLKDLAILTENMKRLSQGGVEVIMAHHPLIYPDVSPLQKRTKNGVKTLKYLSHHNVDIVLTGHVHVPFAIERHPNETEVISIGAGTLSHRRRNKPVSFNHISIDQSDIEVSALEFQNGEFISSKTFSKRVDSLQSRRSREPSPQKIKERDMGHDQLSGN